MKKLIAACCLCATTSVYAECDSNAEKLIKAYPDYLKACQNNEIVWRNGERQLYDDGKQKSFEQLLDNADVQDMFAFAYPISKDSYQPPALNFDPGRVRNEEFFKRMYGSSKEEVKSRLTTIKWLDGENIKIHSANGVPEKLAAVFKEL